MSGPLIVSDTSPLNYLVLIGAVDLLPKLVSGVLIPPAVAAELADHRTPAAVRQWLSTSPAWLQIIAPLSVDPSLQLDRGEAEAISLATERGIRAILIDEARDFASQSPEDSNLSGCSPFSNFRRCVDSSTSGRLSLA